MTQEENIKQNLSRRFNYLEPAIVIPRPRRINVFVSYNNFKEVFTYAVKELGFVHLCTITGLDEGEVLSFIYHVACESGVLLNLKTSVPKANPVLDTIMPYFAGAEIYEREVVDLLGAHVQGLPEGNRYPLTDDWPKGEYPLRKDWKTSVPQQEKGSDENA